MSPPSPPICSDSRPILTPRQRQALWAAAAAAKGHQKDLTEFLRHAKTALEAGVPVLDWRTPQSGDHVAHVLCRHGHLAALRALLELCPALGAKLLAVTNLEAKSLLHEAAQYCQTAVVEFLLADHDLPVNALKRADWTPLMLACTKAENCAVVEVLLSAGADPTLVNKDGWTAFHLASRLGDVALMNALLTHRADLWQTRSHNGRTPLHSAALAGVGPALTRLLQLPYTVDQPDACGSTPLMDSVRRGISSHLAILDLTQHIARSLQSEGIAIDILGVDIDDHLIQRAQNRDAQPNVRFQCVDFMNPESETQIQQYLSERGRTRFDVIFAFSVSMWIHLNHGDAGLGEFLGRMAALSHHVVLEPQPWRCYQTAARRMRKLKEPEFEEMKKLSCRDEASLLELFSHLYVRHKLKLIQDLGTNDWKRRLLLLECQYAN